MKRPLIVAAAVTALVLTGSGVALAQGNEQTPSCAEAIRVYLDARAAFDKLPEKIDNPALIKLAEDVEKATATREDRQAALNAARIAAEPPTDTVSVPADRAAVRDRIKAIEQHIAKPTTTDEDRTKHEGILAKRQAELKAIDTLAAAQTALANATKAQADAPRRIDNPKLKAGAELDARVKAQAAANEACAGQPGAPGRDGEDGQDAEQDNGSTSNNGSNNGGSTSNGTSSNPGPITYSQVESVPSGGVETGA